MNIKIFDFVLLSCLGPGPHLNILFCFKLVYRCRNTPKPFFRVACEENLWMNKKSVYNCITPKRKCHIYIFSNTALMEFEALKVFKSGNKLLNVLRISVTTQYCKLLADPIDDSEVR